MEELRLIAEAHYVAAPPQVKALADNFFRALDNDGNGWVSPIEFGAFMRQYSTDDRLCDEQFFMQLDMDGNGVLDFGEVMTLYYIAKSRRPFCDWCDVFITHTYYSCVACFHSSRGPYNLCVGCYRSGECDHNHNGRVQFLDNYTLLEMKRTDHVAAMAAPPPMMRNNQQMVRSQNNNPAGRRNINARRPPNRNVSRYSNAMVPASGTNGTWNQALRALEVGVSIGNIGTTLCSIL